MKKILVFSLLFSIVIVSNIYAQNIEKMTYEDTQNYEQYVKFKRGNLKEFVTSNKTSISIGDTLTLGKPFVISSDKDSDTYSGLIGGKQSGIGRTMSVFAGDSPRNLSTDFKNEKVIVKKLSYYHLGSKKKPISVTILFKPLHGAFGMNANAYCTDLNLAVKRGELISGKTPMTKEKAISLLKEAKSELDLGILTQKEFDLKKESLLKIIRNKE